VRYKLIPEADNQYEKIMALPQRNEHDGICICQCNELSPAILRLNSQELYLYPSKDNRE
jgi:hypothetical protein